MENQPPIYGREQLNSRLGTNEMLNALLKHAFVCGKNAKSPAWEQWAYYEKNYLQMLAIGTAITALEWRDPSLLYVIAIALAGTSSLLAYIGDFLGKPWLVRFWSAAGLLFFYTAYCELDNSDFYSSLAFILGTVISCLGMLALMTRVLVKRHD